MNFIFLFLLIIHLIHVDNSKGCLFNFHKERVKTIDLFNPEPLSSKAPLWKAQEHSSKPSDFFDTSLLDHPLPTNAWWESIGKIKVKGFFKISVLFVK